MSPARLSGTVLAVLLCCAGPGRADGGAPDPQQELEGALAQADRGELHTAIQRLEHLRQQDPGLAQDAAVAAQLEQLWLRREAQELLPLGQPHGRPALLKARALIEQAYEARRDPSCLLELGKVLRELGEEREAWEQVHLFQSAARPDHPRRREAQALLDGLTPSRLVVVMPEDVPGGASARLDGRPLTRLDLPVSVGRHRLEVSGPWVEPLDEVLEVALGRARVVRVRPRPRATIQLSLPSAPPGLSLSLDGQALPAEPVVSLERHVAPGPHALEARAPGHRGQSWAVNVGPGRTARVTVDLEPDTGTPVWLFGAVAGVAVASAGLGAYLYVRAQGEERAEQARPPKEQTQAAQDEISRDRTAAIIMLTAGGILGVGAGVLALTTRWTSRPPRPRRVDVTWLPPAWTGDGVRLGLLGRF